MKITIYFLKYKEVYKIELNFFLVFSLNYYSRVCKFNLLTKSISFLSFSRK